jgi:CheY-like chemotaxis protein
MTALPRIGGGRVARVTVINDSPEFLETMYSILDGTEGHAVAGFNGDDTTIDQIVDTHPELLIVDLRISGDDMKGWDMLMLARAEPALRHVPLIVCSANVTTLRERAAEFERVGNVFTLEKPFGIDDLTSIVKKALQHR